MVLHDIQSFQRQSYNMSFLWLTLGMCYNSTKRQKEIKDVPDRHTDGRTDRQGTKTIAYYKLEQQYPEKKRFHKQKFNFVKLWMFAILFIF